MSSCRFVAFVVAAILSSSSVALGQLVVQDDFNYPAGSDLSSNGWSKAAALPSILVTSPGLNYVGYIAAGVGNAVSAVGFTDRYYKSISVPTSGNLYAAFMIRVDTASATGGYVVCFFSNNAARGRVWVKNDGTGKLNFGLSGKSASAPVTYDTTKYAFKTTYLVVLKYLILTGSTNDDKYALIVNPLPGKSEPAPTIGPNTDTGNDFGANTSGSSLSIQGRDSTGTKAVVILDGIRVSQNWTDVLPPPPYYYKGTGALEDPANWGVNVDGTGAHPADFATDNQLYLVRNATAVSLTAQWIVTGTGSKVIVGAGVNLTVASGGILAATVDVNSGGTLTLTQGNYWPAFGDNSGTVSFNNTSGFSLDADYTFPTGSGFYDLKSGDINLSGKTLTVKGRFRANGNKVFGTGTFKLDSAGTLFISSPNGITKIGATGDIQSSLRQFSRYGSYVYFGTGNQVTGDAIPDTVANLSIQMGNRNLTTTLSKFVATTGNLTMTLGKFKLGGFNLWFSNPAGQSDSSYVITDGTGALVRPVANTSRKTMPVGSATEYRFAALTMEATPVATNIAFRYVSGDPESAGYPGGVTQHYKGGSWVINSDGTPGGTFRLDLGVTGITDIDTSKMRILARGASGVAWSFPGTVGSYSAGTLSEAGIASFGQFGIGGGAAAPPPPSGKRYLNEVFTNHQVQSNIQFGQAVSKTLFLDLYTGAGDTVKNRPLVIFIHGGGFKGGDKVSNFGTLVCGGLARRGYVVASIDYRTTSTIPSDTAHFEAMLKALQDSKAAVRFFRKNAVTYGIDATQIFATGSSAGSMTALHLAYLDSAEVPKYVTWGNVGGSFEGTSGNPGFSSRIQGVISNWGAIGDTAWMKSGDVPVYCVHGTADSTVFYDKIPADGPFLYSSKYVFAAAQRLSVPSGLRVFSNTGHTLDDSSVKQDSALKDFSAWLYTILKPTTTAVQSEIAAVPTTIALYQNYPNPFNPSTTFEFRVSSLEFVTLRIFDILGREVATLVNEMRPAGIYRVRWDASSLSSGVYFYQLRAGEFIQTKKMVFAK